MTVIEFTGQIEFDVFNRLKMFSVGFQLYNRYYELSYVARSRLFYLASFVTAVISSFNLIYLTIKLAIVSNKVIQYRHLTITKWSKY